MGIIRIGLGLFVFLLISALLKPLVPDDFPYMIISFIVAAWIIWPCMQKISELRFNKLSPKPKKYKLPVPKAFSHIRNVLAESMVDMGYKWHIVTADTITKRIVADVAFTEEESHLESSGIGRSFSIHTKTKQVRRHLRLEVKLTESPQDDSTIAQFNWYPQTEGLNPWACDRVIDETTKTFDELLGIGVDVVDAAKCTHVSSPPIWLLILTGLSLILFTNMIFKYTGEKFENYFDKKEELADSLANDQKLHKDRLKEVEQWKWFKRRHGL